ncbi:alpha/beta hydrolase [Paenibacillus sp. LHD-38]|uniref:alpha/beta fold hydrolase n=1 Tax=Paenibacillus sp. LHD-38 TaxID=3072143 RepID=UPI00280DBA0B|nr:alpha/beta hydrolase [Paenibacillus sp. LHD-38]MDQ8735326.1 alpha/beta hydrolase [Paenibacillus sp. LHD-38]
MIKSVMVNNQDVQIHYLDTKPESDLQLTPMVICPGLSETAEEYEDLLTFLLPRRAIVLSFRGRGNSDTPQMHYDLEDHLSDLAAVIQDASIDCFHLMGYSRGVSYALGYAQLHVNRLTSLIVEDYPPEHKQMSPEWAEDYISNYLVPSGRVNNISPEAVRGIQRESTQLELEAKLSLPTLVLYGLQEGSLLKETDLSKYKQLFSDITVRPFVQSGHNIRGTEKSRLYESIKHFLNEADSIR